MPMQCLKIQALATLLFVFSSPQTSASATTASPEACKCLNWADAYAHHGASCEQDHELPQQAKPWWNLLATSKAKSKSTSALCGHLFEKYNDNHCVNRQRAPMELSSSHSDTWCIVSSRCLDLQGGGRMQGTDLSWKSCAQGADAMLRDLSPEEIIDASALHDADASLIFEYAYIAKEADLEDEATHSELQQRLQDGEGHQPTMFLPADKGLLRVVVAGGQACAIEENGDHRDAQHPGTFWRWSCTAARAT